jgi:glutaminyl-tRNA synthetase
MNSDGGSEAPTDFIRDRVRDDLASGRVQQVKTRFPPEPNGYLHIGHAKSICLNFGLAEEFAGTCNLRMDDTNPAAEEQEYVDAIQDDIRWLGFRWHGEVLHASDYFEQIYRWAEQLVEQGDAYVDDLSAEEISRTRGTLTEPGTDSPHRSRSVQENLALLRAMRAGNFADGARVLRAKIDMAHPNVNLRDPILYRIRHLSHQRTGDRWCIYPTYDWAHGQSDSKEGITHSICTLEFEHHRPLYDWFLERLGIYAPKQIEFARLNLTYTVMSKRKLLQLVQGAHVTGWDDPRMPTIRGLRRRGCTPEAIRAFCRHIGTTRFNATHEIELLEYFLRDHLNKTAPRRMAVLDPIKLVIENYDAGRSEPLDAVNNPEDSSAGTRKVPFSRELWIEREDFQENPPKDFFRLAPGREVRLRYAYFVKCTGVEKDQKGNVTAVRCTYDPDTRGGDAPDGRKVKATIHWVSAAQAVAAEVRLIGRLFTDPEPGGRDDYLDLIDPKSLEVRRGCKLEPALQQATGGEHYQFERLGYFYVDHVDSKPKAPVFHRTVGLKDAYQKKQKQAQPK